MSQRAPKITLQLVVKADDVALREIDMDQFVGELAEIAKRHDGDPEDVRAHLEQLLRMTKSGA